MNFSTYTRITFEATDEGARIEIREKKHWWSREKVRIYTDKDPGYKEAIKELGIIKIQNPFRRG